MSDRPTDLARSFGEMRSARAGVRPLRLSDAEAWTRGMRANAARMAPWWSAVDDWEAATDRVAFTDHALRARKAARQGRGLTLALCEDDVLTGELAFYNLTPGGAHAEAGLWLHPDASAMRNYALLFARVAAWMFDRQGIVRIDAPVACDNSLPVKLLITLGFVHDARIPLWRSINGVPCDYDIYGLTMTRLDAARPLLSRIAQRAEPAAGGLCS